MRKHLSKKLQAVALIVLVGWALDGHVPGLNEPVAPDPAPLPIAEHVENAVEHVRQVAEGVQVQTQQLIENIQNKSVAAGENFTKNRRSLGIGITNLAGYLAKNKLKFPA